MSDKNTPNQFAHQARIYNTSGALNDLLEKIDDPKIQTLEKILQFRKDYSIIRQKKLSDSIAHVKQQTSAMMSELNWLILERYIVEMKKFEELTEITIRLERELLTPSPKCNFLLDFYYKIKKRQQNIKFEEFKKNFHESLKSATKFHDKYISQVQDNIKNNRENLETVAEDNIFKELRDLDATNSIIESEKYLMAGAIGEASVITELKKLPYSYHVINNFRMKFDPPIYNRAENDRIFSIQIDHLVVGPSGVFIIETKYWSDKSISGDAFFSPVKQVKRAGFALFVVLNGAIRSGDISGLKNNWGERKISPKQIVVSINSVPHGEFQYVRVLGIDQLNSHITYGRQEYTSEEVQGIVEHLLELEL